MHERSFEVHEQNPKCTNGVALDGAVQRVLLLTFAHPNRRRKRNANAAFQNAFETLGIMRQLTGAYFCHPVIVFLL